MIGVFECLFIERFEDVGFHLKTGEVTRRRRSCFPEAFEETWENVFHLRVAVDELGGFRVHLSLVREVVGLSVQHSVLAVVLLAVKAG